MPLNPGPSFCRKSIAILAIAGLLLPPASADLSEAREAAKRVPPKSSGPLTGASGQNSAMSMQMPMVFPLFLQNQEFSSTLVLTSAAAQSTYADIILTRTDGREITHQRVEFTPHSQRTVEVLTLLESVVSPATTGTITIFQAPEFTDTMVILGQLAITYKGSREPNYVDEEVAMPSTRGSQILRAVADAGVGSPVVALTNGNPNGTDGYQTLVPYAMKSFFGAQITFENANETFAKQGDIYTGNNWPAYAVGGGFTSTGNFFDNICVVSTGGLTPMPQPPQGGNVGIDYASQAWFVGTNVEGGGVEVWSDTLTRYRDHGTVTNIVSPVR